MKKISNKMVIAICLIVIAIIIYYYQNVKVYDADLPITGVIVAKSNIPPNTVVTKDMIYLDQRYTNDMLKQKGSLTSKEEKVLGKRTKETIYKDEPMNLSRLIENEPYMDDKDLEKKLFVIAINTMDKALNIEKGDFIDIWLELNENGIAEKNQLLGTESNQSSENIENTDIDADIKKNYNAYPLFRKLQVFDTKTEAFNEVNAKGESEKSVVNYLTLHLTDKEIATYLGIKDWNVTKRVTLYGKNVEYMIINEQFEKKEESKTVEDSSTEILPIGN